MARATLLTGGNTGDAAAALDRAAALIAERAGPVVAASGVRRSPAWGFEGGDFLNQVLVVDTRLTPHGLLAVTQAIERELGRVQAPPEYTPGGERIYRDRPIDIDILYYDGLRIDTPSLVVPHPRIAQRQFVLDLLAELDYGVLA